MKKVVVVLMAVVILASLALTGCASPTPTAAPEPTAAAEQPTMQWWNTHDCEEPTVAPENCGRQYKIGILAPAVTHGWVAAVCVQRRTTLHRTCRPGGIQALHLSNAEEMTTQLDDLLTWVRSDCGLPAVGRYGSTHSCRHRHGRHRGQFRHRKLRCRSVPRLRRQRRHGRPGPKYIVDKIGT